MSLPGVFPGAWSCGTVVVEARGMSEIDVRSLADGKHLDTNK
ncbi:MAG: hypothetical protein ACI9DC_004671 [Gammaproteobacteria bacterium]|jgi:hypothetical protein